MRYILGYAENPHIFSIFAQAMFLDCQTLSTPRKIQPGGPESS